MSAMKNGYVEGGDKADHCDYQKIYHCDSTITIVVTNIKPLALRGGK